MPRSFKNKLSRNQCNNNIKYREKFSIKDPNGTREALMMERMNNNNLWEDDITNQMSALEILGVFQYYPPKTKFEKNDGCQQSPMRMIFDIKQQYLIQK